MFIFNKGSLNPESNAKPRHWYRIG